MTFEEGRQKNRTPVQLLTPYTETLDDGTAKTHEAGSIAAIRDIELFTCSSLGFKFRHLEPDELKKAQASAQPDRKVKAPAATVPES